MKVNRREEPLQFTQALGHGALNHMTGRLPEGLSAWWG
jgi:hypothetical protein